VPETLLESELFGHKKGAFTGADRDRPGRFREAHQGTLFLDEVGDMPAAAQAKLLRVLQDGVVEPLGGGKSFRVDVRVLAATHRDLEELCRDGAFREDLYYRLRVVEIVLPPLRERGEDVLELARTFLAAAGRGPIEISPEAAGALLGYGWPGNVRELRNAMERAAIFCSEGVVALEDLPAEIRDGSSGSAPEAGTAWTPGADFASAKEEVVERFERRYFSALLAEHGGNVSHAAKAAGIFRQNLQKKLRQLGIDPRSFR
jgi:DNA-binding NtrC family response regulator